MTRAKWSMIIGAVVVVSSVFAGAAFAANGDKSDPGAVHGVAEKQALMDQSEKSSYEFDKEAASSPEALQADLDAGVAAGLMTQDQADNVYAKVSAAMGW